MGKCKVILIVRYNCSILRHERRQKARNLNLMFLHRLRIRRRWGRAFIDSEDGYGDNYRISIITQTSRLYNKMYYIRWHLKNCTVGHLLLK